MANEIISEAAEKSRLLTNTVSIQGSETDPDLNNNAASVTVAEISNRVSAGLQALYTFQENGGTMVHDVSGVGTALDLQVANAAAVSWLPGALSVDSATDISSAAAATKLADAVNSTTELTLEAWVAPASDNQPPTPAASPTWLALALT